MLNSEKIPFENLQYLPNTAYRFLKGPLWAVREYLQQANGWKTDLWYTLVYKKQKPSSGAVE